MLPTRRTSRWMGRRGLPELRTEMDRLLSDFFGDTEETLRRWTPATDLYETDQAYRIDMELPGFERGDIDVRIEQGALTVSGSREATTEETEEDYHLRERSAGQFKRTFSLPRSIDTENVNARFENGILKVEVPKTAEAKSRQIEVEVA